MEKQIKTQIIHYREFKESTGAICSWLWGESPKKGILFGEGQVKTTSNLDDVTCKRCKKTRTFRVRMGLLEESRRNS